MKKIPILNVWFSTLFFFIYNIGNPMLFAQVVNVSTATQLQNALNAALPGQTIVLANGTYNKSGGFVIPPGTHGTSANPITLQGTSNTIITCSNISSGYGLGVRGSNYWVFDGFYIRNCSKGLVTDSSHHNIIRNVRVTYIGYEGIHLRSYSSFNLVSNCFVDTTGLTSPGTAEGIYVGSAVSNWPTYTNGNPDTANYNVFSGNSFGDFVGSENIDVKEGTTGGTISFNTFNGAGLNNQNAGDSWIDVKGNNYLIECNNGANTILDGFQTHIVQTGWGNYNKFNNNTLTVNQVSGRGINVQTNSGTYGPAANNLVCSNNSSIGAGLGMTNVSTQSCSGSCSLSLSSTIFSKEATAVENTELIAYPNPVAEILSLVVPRDFLGSSFTLMNVLNQTCLSGSITTVNTEIITGKLSPGTYLLLVIGPTSIWTKKIIKR